MNEELRQLLKDIRDDYQLGMFENSRYINDMIFRCGLTPPPSPKAEHAMARVRQITEQLEKNP